MPPETPTMSSRAMAEVKSSDTRQIEFEWSAMRLAGNLHCGRLVEVDFVLQNFLHDNLHLVFAGDIHQRPSARVERDHPLLDQRGEFESPSHFVDNSFFFERLDHLTIPLVRRISLI